MFDPNKTEQPVVSDISDKEYNAVRTVQTHVQTRYYRMFMRAFRRILRGIQYETNQRTFVKEHSWQVLVTCILLSSIATDRRTDKEFSR